MDAKRYNSAYEDERNGRIAFPMGGMGAGMLCLGGRGELSHVSLRNHPDVTHEPVVFSAVCIKGREGNAARVLEGQVPGWKVFGFHKDSGNGLHGKHYGLPRFTESSFQARFPFGIVRLKDRSLPLEVSIKGWSPFTPLRSDDSSLPVAALEFTFTNNADHPLEFIYSFHAANFMASGPDTGEVQAIERGFILHQPAAQDKPWEQGSFCAVIDQPEAKVNYTWFRGGWFDPLTMVWNAIESWECPEAPPVTEGKPSPGASMYVPLELAPGESKKLRLMLSWHVPETNSSIGVPEGSKASAACQTSHKPWYSAQFGDVASVAKHWAERYDELLADTERFTECFHDSTLPPEVLEAVSANLSILKSPTVLRQTDGRLWGWEGCHDDRGCCHGTCTHVWNYAQALPHLFPELERGMRETELNEHQDLFGHQNFRVPLPIMQADHQFHAAADGQLGGIMKLYREWRVSGDLPWLKRMWPKAKRSLQYCIETWDPRRKGVLEEPHHNTYDIEFWGPDGMCSSVYLGALKAASLMAQSVGEPGDDYDGLYRKGKRFLEEELFNGEYFEQRIQWEGLSAPSPVDVQSFHKDYSSPEAMALLKEQGPKYQYGRGCLSDGIFGAWLARMCGLGDILDSGKVKSHLLSVYKNNLKHDLSEHANPQRPGYALGREGGLLLCTWPRGGRLALPFVYSDEVWTGIEYQVASHLMCIGCVAEGLDIVRTCRDRYDGLIRNPFNEYECGHWYARAMASYGLLEGMTGIRYDACDRTLYVQPGIEGDFRSFLCTEKGYGTAGVRGGKPFFETVYGDVPIDRIEFAPGS